MIKIFYYTPKNTRKTAKELRFEAIFRVFFKTQLIF